MERLFAFIRRRAHWFLFVLLEIAALGWVFNGGWYHSYMNHLITNQVVGKYNTWSSELFSYLNLREENEELLKRYATLESKYIALNRSIEYAAADTVEPFLFPIDSIPDHKEFDFLTARVVNLTFSRSDNIIMINKGLKEGVRIDQGVVSARGVVGIVSNVSDHFAQVVPLINHRLKLSCRMLKGGYLANLQWEAPRHGSARSYLSDLPSHAKYAPGDTVLTSGYSNIFPPRMVVGVVDSISRNRLNERNVRLATDFHNLKHVYVIMTDPSKSTQPFSKESTR